LHQTTLMKKLPLISCCLLFIHFSFGQTPNKLAGKWQADTTKITDRYFDTYQFFNNGRFVFKPNEYDGLSRVISITGVYKVSGDTLFLTPNFTKEIVGGNFVRSQKTILADTWQIVNGQAKIIPCKKRLVQSAVLKINGDGKSLLLDDRNFYKLKPDTTMVAKPDTTNTAAPDTTKATKTLPLPAIN
jgi:hypothetical protein